mgnify:CR=1 FL=1
MMTIAFNVRNQRMELCENVFMASETVNYVDCRFYFSEEWSGFEKTAIFSNIGGSYSVLLSGDACIVPHEVLSDSFSVSVFGIQNGEKFRRITTNAVSVQVSSSGYKEGDTPDEPTPDVYETIVLRLADGEKQIKAVGDKNTQLGAEIESVKNSVSADKAAIEGEIDDCCTEVNAIKTDLSKLPEKYAAKTHLHKAEDITDLNIPTKMSQLDNDSGLVADENYVHTDNNYTDAEKAKLAGLHLYDDTGIKAEIDAKADIPHTTESGYPLELTDSLADERLTDCKVWGNTDGVGDLSTADNKYHVPITVCGKNVLDIAGINSKGLYSATISSGVKISYDKDTQIITLNGTSTSSVSTNQFVLNHAISGDAVISAKVIGGTVSGNGYCFGLSSTAYVLPGDVRIQLTENGIDTAKSAGTRTLQNSGKYVVIQSNTAVTYNNFQFQLQIEKGITSTEYEPYTNISSNAVLDTPLTPGEYIDLIRKKRVNGSTETDITVAGELKTVDSDVNNIICGTTVAPEKTEVEYYQDINKVITELRNAILAQGGNT